MSAESQAPAAAQTASGAPIVVGVSRRTGSPAALRFAVEEARLRGTSVLAVTAWRPPRPPGAPAGKPVGFPPISPAMVWEQESDRLAAMIDAHLDGDAAAAGVTFELRRGQPAAVLLAAAHGAQLLVLDSPRAGNLTTLPKAWIAPGIVFRADCPVIVMPVQRGARIRDRLLQAVGTAGRPGISGMRPPPPPD